MRRIFFMECGINAIFLSDERTHIPLLGPWLNSGLNPTCSIQSNVLNTIVIQFFTQYFMINGIKRLRQVQKNAKRCFSSVNS